MRDVYVHPHALCESEHIGEGSCIWAFAHVMEGATIGPRCNIGDHAFIESGAKIGDGVTIKNGVMVWKGVEVADSVFIGPGVVFTNDLFPRSQRMPSQEGSRRDEADWLVRTRVEEGVSIGANATILPGIVLGSYCMIGAGSVVTKDIEPHRLVTGNPASPAGYVDYDGTRLTEEDGQIVNPQSGMRYRIENGRLCRVSS
ncbi:acyltransferase [Kiritimatiella glycovorans]|uniref:dTDP-3-amino-3,6-dideoxy-alpha-D-galactopyranose 3-N-acetyltransferase n=1 Tax=Kiritimatiella glycovorans TaxID=1307763 RepID=A0A0G3EJ92_9BACT|nr:acyltransferase [Kiritimatiella glycovorans]AKJ65507.1 dTDP-3-amino-3,6-dideoxy-alpha-D-galactopyranose 3-N-acetyltransferase [Kiritimatiella glycovorans]